MVLFVKIKSDGMQQGLTFQINLQGAGCWSSMIMSVVLFGQWHDNKIVSFISSLGVSGMVTVSRRIGSKKVLFDTEEALKVYICDNFMKGVDNVDKDKNIGGSFTKTELLEKWYCMGLLGIFDFMVSMVKLHGMCQLGIKCSNVSM